MTNTGGDLGNNHFDILMPGGGVGERLLCPPLTIHALIRIHLQAISPKDARRSSVAGTGYVVNLSSTPILYRRVLSRVLNTEVSRAVINATSSPVVRLILFRIVRLNLMNSL